MWKLKEKIMKISKGIFYLCLAVSIGLIVGGFFVPPMGVIDGSVLTAVGELFGFAMLGMLPSLLNDHDVELCHGNTTISVKKEDDETSED